MNQQSLCPWKYEVKRRPNRFPHYKSVVKCTCDSCQPILDDDLKRKHLYTCHPVLQSQPSLVKGKCGSDGYYDWKPELEFINVACVCGYSNTYKPLK